MGDGDVAKNNIKSAASLSVGARRGVVCWDVRPGGGVWWRIPDSGADILDVVDGDAASEIPEVVRAELWANCEYEYVDPLSDPSKLDRGEVALPAIFGRW